MSRRVVISGMGLISPLGNAPSEMWEALVAQRSGVRPLKSIPTDHFPSHSGAEAWDFEGKIEDFGPLDKTVKRTIKKGLKLMCREIQMGVAAAQLALHDAGLASGSFDVERTGVVYGSDYIMTLPEEFSQAVRKCLDEQQEFQFESWAEQGLPEITPLWLLKYLPNMPASHIAIYNDLRGPNNSLTLREASANLALGEAYWTIRRGSADTLLAGATGTRVHSLRTIHVVLQEELAGNSVPPEQLSRPFDLNRSGMVVGEGAGTVVLEEYETAQRRGATIVGEVLGHGSSTVRTREGVARIDQAIENVLRQCLRSSGLSPDQIGHVHAHGVASLKSDREEAQAIAKVFSGRNEPVPVVAAKSYFGNLGAAGGLVEVIASLLALQHDQLPVVLNYETPDPECPVAVVREARAAGDAFINLNVTPQGQASGIVISRFQG